MDVKAAEGRLKDAAGRLAALRREAENAVRAVLEETVRLHEESVKLEQQSGADARAAAERKAQVEAEAAVQLRLTSEAQFLL